jgi:ribonuclease BN (tRNA processing enzyme)
VKIHILGAHNNESRTTSCVCLLIDDTLVIDAGGLTSNLSISNQQKLKTILLTHQHYDHIRDIPGIALNLSHRGISIDVYSTHNVRAAIEMNLLNGNVYPRFQELPETKPTVSFNNITPHISQNVDGHSILAIPVNHIDNTVGYQVSDKQGKTIFYTSDTGPNLSDCWKHVSPQMLFIDVTVPNVFEEFARKTRHLTPNLLKEELIDFREQKGYLPQIVAIHMDTKLEQKIKDEIAVIADGLKTPIIMAQEGMQLYI